MTDLANVTPSARPEFVYDPKQRLSMPASSWISYRNPVDDDVVVGELRIPSTYGLRAEWIDARRRARSSAGRASFVVARTRTHVATTSTTVTLVTIPGTGRGRRGCTYATVPTIEDGLAAGIAWIDARIRLNALVPVGGSWRIVDDAYRMPDAALLAAIRELQDATIGGDVSAVDWWRIDVLRGEATRREII